MLKNLKLPINVFDNNGERDLALSIAMSTALTSIIFVVNYVAVGAVFKKLGIMK